MGSAGDEAARVQDEACEGRLRVQARVCSRARVCTHACVLTGPSYISREKL